MARRKFYGRAQCPLEQRPIIEGHFGMSSAVLGSTFQVAHVTIRPKELNG